MFHRRHPLVPKSRRFPISRPPCPCTYVAQNSGAVPQRGFQAENPPPAKGVELAEVGDSSPEKEVTASPKPSADPSEATTTASELPLPAAVSPPRDDPKLYRVLPRGWIRTRRLPDYFYSGARAGHAGRLEATSSEAAVKPP